MITTGNDLLRYIRKKMLRAEMNYYQDEILVRAFFDELNDRQKRGVKKRSTNHYSDWLWYVSYDGRLARVPNTNKNPLGTKLLKEKKIKVDSYGILRSKEIITQGSYPKIRRLIEELDPTHKWSATIVNKICQYLDGGLECTMIIDRQFDKAYAPEYHQDFCLEGDLVTGTSCMSGCDWQAQEFYGGIDGCYVARFENSDGEQVGRCLMYEYNGIRHFIRIYAQKDYARCALRLLRQEMRENDLFGRNEHISGLRLHTNWSLEDTHTMYLDGEYYGWDIDSNCVSTDYTFDMKTTANETLENYLYDCDWRKCSECGEWHDKDDMLYVDDEWFCDEDCAEKYGCVRCAYCDKWELSDSDGYYLPDGDWVCSTRCLHDMEYTICRECGEIISYDEAITVDYEDYCSEDCVKSAGYEKCAECGNWFNNMKVDTTTGEKVCSSCANDRGLELVYVKKEEAKND